MVVDASVSLAWWLPDEATEQTNQILYRLESEVAAVPSVWPLEVINALLKAERIGRITQSLTVQFLASLADLSIVVDSGDLATTVQSIPPLARAHGLTSYDASYLELAMRLGLPLATLDEDLLDAARIVGVPLVL